MRKIKGFSYDPKKDKEIIAHIDKQQNGSRYIWDLVRKDMEGEHKKIEKIVQKYIEKHFKIEEEDIVTLSGILEILGKIK